MHENQHQSWYNCKNHFSRCNRILLCFGASQVTDQYTVHHPCVCPSSGMWKEGRSNCGLNLSSSPLQRGARAFVSTEEMSLVSRQRGWAWAPEASLLRWKFSIVWFIKRMLRGRIFPLSEVILPSEIIALTNWTHFYTVEGKQMISLVWLHFRACFCFLNNYIFVYLNTE